MGRLCTVKGPRAVTPVRWDRRRIPPPTGREHRTSLQRKLTQGKLNQRGSGFLSVRWSDTRVKRKLLRVVEMQLVYLKPGYMRVNAYTCIPTYARIRHICTMYTHADTHLHTHTHFHRRCFFLFLPFLLFSAFLMGKRHIYFENTAQKIHHTHHTNKELT